MLDHHRQSSSAGSYRLATTALLSLCVLSGASAQEPPANPALIDSPWAVSHRGASQQASSPHAGPVAGSLTVQSSDHSGLEPGGFNGGSPWLTLSSKKYSGSPNARTVWGTTVTHAYKYVVDGPTFQLADSFRIDGGIFSIHWNLVGLSGDRIIVPAPGGYFQSRDNAACGANKRALLELRDGSTPTSPIQCVKSFRFTGNDLTNVCGNNINVWKTNGPQNVAVLTSGKIAVTLREDPDVQDDSDDRTFVAIVDNNLNTLEACTLLDDSAVTNQFPVEGNSMFFVTGDAFIKLNYDPASQTLTEQWNKPYAFRNRSGTTPTLIGFGSNPDKLVVAIDSRCVQVNPFESVIECDPAGAPSKVVAVRRNNAYPQVFTFDLPSAIDTVENSPAARGYDMVVAQYGGYEAQPGTPGAVAKFHWDSDNDVFVQDWLNTSVLFNGVPSISDAANLVYSSGIAADGNFHFYGLRFRDQTGSPGGSTVIDQVLGPQEYFRDQGNNTVINDDGSAIWSGHNGMARVRN